MQARIGRRRFAAGASALATVAVCRYPAGAAEFSYKFATEVPPQHRIAMRWGEAAQKILADTGGRLEIRIFPSAQLGGQAQQLAQVRLGAIEFASGLDVVLGTLVPVAGITGTPYVFRDGKEALAAMDGPLGQYRRTAISKVGLYAFEKSWDVDFKQVFNALRPIATPADLRGLRLRTAEATIEISLFKALGASPTPLSLNEVYTSMKTHLVDGIVTPLNGVEDQKLYEVGKFVSYTNHTWGAFTMIANAETWQRLPENVRTIAERHINAASALSNGDTVKLRSVLEGQLTSQGIVFNRPNLAEFQSYIQKTGLYGEWRKSYGTDAWTLLEKSIGKTLA